MLPENSVEIIAKHPAEEGDRREALKLKISGFEISGEFEPSQKVVNRCWFDASAGTSCVCTTRRQREMLDLPDEPLLEVSANGFLQRPYIPLDPQADVRTRVCYGMRLQRRALTAETSGLYTDEVMSQLA